MRTITAAQLVYSNVEAEHSPTGRRGFQVWLCSRRLKEHQREIARRLEDYDWPTAEANANIPTQRYCYFRTSAGEFVIARTVPLVERDALRRAGRFHAHAVVVPVDQFALIENDPFAIIDGFSFQNGPGPIIEAGPPDGGFLPDAAEIPVAVPGRGSLRWSASIARILPLITSWLAGGDDPRPIAIPAHPDEVIDFLRSLIQVLPVSLRARMSFDTLSTGQSLGTLSYRFAGGYDLATLRDWPYRRAYRLDPQSGEFAQAPELPIPEALQALAEKWAESPLSGPEREQTFQVVLALIDPACPVLPREVTEPSIDVIRQLPGIDEGYARHVRNRLHQDLPGETLRALLEPAALDWLLPLGAETLERLGAPIPSDRLIGWLFQTVQDHPPDVDVARELHDWSWEQLSGDAVTEWGRQTAAKLYLIAVGSLPKAAQRLDELHHKPGWDELIDRWYREWYLTHGRVRHYLYPDMAAMQFAEGIFQASSRLPADLVDELETVLTISTDGTLPHEVFRRLSFAVAFRRADGDLMAALLSDRDRVYAEWVIHQAIQSGVTAILGLGDLSQDRPGLLLDVGGRLKTEQGAALFDALIESTFCHQALYDRAYVRADQRAPRPTLYPDGALKKPHDLYEKRNWDRLGQELDKLSAMDLRQFLADRLHDKVRVSRILAVRGEDAGQLWVGPCIESNNYQPEIFARLYTVVIESIQRTPPGQREERVAALLAALRR